MKMRCGYWLMLLTFWCAACEGEIVVPSFGDFSSGETGYLSNKGVEFQLTVTNGKLTIDTPAYQPVPAYNPDEAVSKNTDFIFNQLMYLRNPLASDFSLFANQQWESAKFREWSYETGQNQATFSYSLDIDAIGMIDKSGRITLHADTLSETQVAPAELVGWMGNADLPNHINWFEQVDPMLCSSNPDSEFDPVIADDLHDYSYFYYFDANQSSCPLKDKGALTSVTYEISAVHDTGFQNSSIVWPEYDRLLKDKDGRIFMAALYGSIRQDDFDYGWPSYRIFTSLLLKNGFQKEGDLHFPDDPGKVIGTRFTRMYQASRILGPSMQVIVDAYNPDGMLADADRVFQMALSNNQLIYFSGHSRYGSLEFLDHREYYPANTYQIIFMDSCRSYSYYTRQVFQAKATAEDPKGTRYADVINNAELGYSGSEATAIDLYLNLFDGAWMVAQGQNPDKYSWNNLIAYMNLSAEKRAEVFRWNPEVYGVSGVLDNCYTPFGSRCTESSGNAPVQQTFYSDAPLNILDNDPTGISSNIFVNDNFIIDDIQVHVDITHSYMADLVVTLTREPYQPEVLRNREQSEADRIGFGRSISTFNGSNVQGSWTLIVSDNAMLDNGTLNRWSLSFLGHR